MVIFKEISLNCGNAGTYCDSDFCDHTGDNNIRSYDGLMVLIVVVIFVIILVIIT